MNKIKPAIFIFLILSSIVTLFPPFQWGTDRLRTIDERRISHNYYSDLLPIKEYNFIFSSSKKDFTINNRIISLDRSVITSEIILEYFLAIFISALFYFLYIKYGSITFGAFMYLLMAGFIIIVWSDLGRDFLMLFNPSYDVVSNSEKEVKEKYSDWINSFSPFVFINGLKEINASYPYGWNDSTKKVWDHIKDKIIIHDEQLPRINDYIFPYRKENTNKPGLNELIRMINSDYASEFHNNKNEILKYYPDFTLPSNKYLLASNLLADIDKINYDYFKNNYTIDMTYLKVRDSYFQSQGDYKLLVDKINLYTTIIISIILILLLFYKKLSVAKYLSRLVNA